MDIYDINEKYGVALYKYRKQIKELVEYIKDNFNINGINISYNDIPYMDFAYDLTINISFAKIGKNTDKGSGDFHLLMVNQLLILLYLLMITVYFQKELFIMNYIMN